MSSTGSTLPFDEKHLRTNFDYKSCVWMELSSSAKCYGLAKTYIYQSLIHDAEPRPRSFCVEQAIRDATSVDEKKLCRVLGTIGLGLFSFVDYNGNVLRALHQVIGEPVGTNYGAVQYTNLILFAQYPLNGNHLADFCDELIKRSEATEEGKFSIYKFDVCRQYWSDTVRCKGRPIDSVILRQDIKDKLLSDLERFLSPKTKAYYESHGIPYRRSYLFYGVPGAGKTSLIQALAGKFERNLCFLQPTHPKMTDDSLYTAIQTIPVKSIVVLEDVDSLFTKDRKCKVNESALTFSGLLNALDGVGDSSGQIYILSTNLRDNLDPALIRNGRVDLHVEFTYATKEQMKGMWKSFYPGENSEQHSNTFADTLSTLLEGRVIATAGLQHFFVRNMRSSPEEALADVPSIIADLDERSTTSAIAATEAIVEDPSNTAGGEVAEVGEES